MPQLVKYYKKEDLNEDFDIDFDLKLEEDEEKK